MKKILIFFMILSMPLMLTSCKDEDIYEYGEKEMLSKIWNNNIIYNETVVLEDNGSEISGKLLFEVTKIISVRDYTLENEYDPSEYYFEGNKIIRSNTSTIPYLTTTQLAGKNLPDGYGFSTYAAKEPNTEIIFTEGISIIMHQIAITYTHNGSFNFSQTYQGNYLPNLLKKLENKETVKVVLNGDSISTGANSSGKLGIAPYLDDFGTLFVNQLKRIYKVEAELINTSLGGTLSNWGKENVDTNINTYNPDLVIIAFGMNDGSWNIPAFKYKENIDFMIRSIKSRNPDADILLISTIVANPISIQDKIQSQYLTVLKELVEEHQVGLVDMTTLSTELFKIKKGVDLLANNINHPSDFLVRCYVTSLLAAVVKDY